MHESSIIDVDLNNYRNEPTMHIRFRGSTGPHRQCHLAFLQDLVSFRLQKVMRWVAFPIPRLMIRKGMESQQVLIFLDLRFDYDVGDLLVLIASATVDETTMTMTTIKPTMRKMRVMRNWNKRTIDAWKFDCICLTQQLPK
jgi:hypothetical protein